MAISTGMGAHGIVAIDIPPFGNPEDVLTKLTEKSYDMYWSPGGGGGSGGTNPGALAGAALMFLSDPDGDDSHSIVFSERGPVGPTGPSGAALFILQDDVGEDPLQIPGSPGLQGVQGPAGSGGGGTTIVLINDEEQQDMPIPLSGLLALLDRLDQQFSQRQIINTDVTTGTPRAAQLTIRNTGAGVASSQAARLRLTDVLSGLDVKSWDLNVGFGALGIQSIDEAGAVIRNALLWGRTAGSPAITSASYGNTTDFFQHTFHGLISQAYSLGAFTLLTGRFATIVKRMQLTGTQRASLQGTSRLRLS